MAHSIEPPIRLAHLDLQSTLLGLDAIPAIGNGRLGHAAPETARGALTRRAGLVALLSGVALLVATPAQAGGKRYVGEIPGLGPMTVDPATVSGRISRNRRSVVGSDFGTGHVVPVGGKQTSYTGINDPIVGDFNGDGYDDIGVRWTGSGHTGKWTISLNDGKGGFLGGKGVTFAGSTTAYVGDNRAFVGDFNGDGYDDVGVQWKSGPHAGQWYISLNDKKGNFASGKPMTIGGSTTAYSGSNDPIVGDFNGDGYDDLGVRWTGSGHTGKWTVSLNDGKGGFGKGAALTFGTKTKAYTGSNIALVGDFNGDGHDDIAVKWTGSGHTGKWTISLNDADGTLHFTPGRGVTFGSRGSSTAYVGANVPLVGDFANDGYDDVGVHWTGDDAKGKWVVSTNLRKKQITQTRATRVRIPIIFINFEGAKRTGITEAKALLDEVRRFFLRSSHGRLDLEFRHEIVTLNEPTKWVAGLPQPKYDPATGALLNPNDYPAVEDYTGYWCRFNHPTAPKPQIIFKNAKGNLEWDGNSNIHRNYCQVAERNYSRDALKKLQSVDPQGFEELMTWARAGADGPTIVFSAPELISGGNRYFRKSWNGTLWPFEVGGLTFTSYIFMRQSPRTLAHEVGHFIGHGPELYENASGSQCKSGNTVGYVGRYGVMGSQYAYFPAFNGVNRWRFGFTEARTLIPSDGTVEITLSRAMSAGSSPSVVVIQPDPTGHPDEVFVVENRGTVTTAGFEYDELPLADEGIFIYRVNSKAPTKAQPLIDLVEEPGSCPKSLVPYQGSFTPTSTPAARFHDGKSAKFSITNITKSGTELKFKVSFGR